MAKQVNPPAIVQKKNEEIFKKKKKTKVFLCDVGRKSAVVCPKSFKAET